MNDDDSFRLLDDKDVFYVCMLLFMFALVFGGCSAPDEKRPLTASERVKLGYPCAMWIRQSGGPTPPVFACVKSQ